ncbi:TRAP transporter TatT component family protein [Deltaproteobacteria bacterium TL4]
MIEIKRAPVKLPAMSLRYLLLMLSVGFVLSSCSFTDFAVNTGAEIVVPGSTRAILEETDLEFVKMAIPANVKLIEGILELSPHNKILNEVLAQSFLFYSLAFVDEEYQKLKFSDQEEQAALFSQRAQAFYLRGRSHGLRIFAEHEKFMTHLFGKLESFEPSLQELEKEEVPGLVYLSMNWLLYITHNMNHPQEIIHIGRIKMMIQRAIDLDESFFYGFPHIAMGAFEASIPQILGGNPEKGKQHFERAIELTNGKFLLAQVMFAQSYAVQMLDETLFDQLLKQVLTAPDDLLKEAALPNAIAKVQARRLIQQKNDLF